MDNTQENYPTQLDTILRKVLKNKNKETKTRKTEVLGSTPVEKKDKNGSHVCLECGRVFPSSVRLQNHSYVHTGEKPYKCPQCGKLFRHYGSIRRHLLVHSGVKHYKCAQCDRLFRDHSNLRQHLDSHKNHKSFFCSICNRAYKTKRTLQNHRCSAELDFNDDDENIYEQLHGIANYCRVEFRQENWTQRANGAGKRLVHCSMCVQVFTSIKLFLIHLVVDHKVNMNLVRITKAQSSTRKVKEKRQKINKKKHKPVSRTSKRKSNGGTKKVRANRIQVDPSVRYNCVVCGRIIKHINYLKKHLMKHHNVAYDDLSDNEQKLSKFKVSDETLKMLERKQGNPNSVCESVPNDEYTKSRSQLHDKSSQPPTGRAERTEPKDIYDFSDESDYDSASAPQFIHRGSNQGFITHINYEENHTDDEKSASSTSADIYEFNSDDDLQPLQPLQPAVESPGADVEWAIVLDSDIAPLVLKDVYDFDENDDIESVCLSADVLRNLNLAHESVNNDDIPERSMNQRSKAKLVSLLEKPETEEITSESSLIMPMSSTVNALSVYEYQSDSEACLATSSEYTNSKTNSLNRVTEPSKRSSKATRRKKHDVNTSRIEHRNENDKKQLLGSSGQNIEVYDFTD